MANVIIMGLRKIAAKSFFVVAGVFIAFAFLFYGAAGKSYAAEVPERFQFRASHYESAEAAAIESLSKLKFAKVVFVKEAKANDGAEPAAPVALPELGEPSTAEIAALVNGILSLKGAGTLAIVAFVIQVLMLLLKSGLGKIAGKFQLLSVLLLSVVGGIVQSMIAGNLSFKAAALSASALAAYQVLGNQIIKQFLKKA